MTEMISGEGEHVEFSEELYPAGNVEDWLGEVERVMLESVRAQCDKAVVDYAQSARTEWVLRWPGTDGVFFYAFNFTFIAIFFCCVIFLL